MNCLLVSTSRSQRLRSFWSAPRITILWANPKKRNKIPVSRGKEKNQNIRENLIDQPKMVLHVLNKKPFETRPLFFFFDSTLFCCLMPGYLHKKISVFILMAHDVDVGERQKKKKKNRWRLNSFLMSNLSFFSQEIYTANNHVNEWFTVELLHNDRRGQKKLAVAERFKQGEIIWTVRQKMWSL